MASSTLSCSIKPGRVDQFLDPEFDGKSTFTVPEIDKSKLPRDWGIGLIIGPSGSGKTSLLRRYFGEPCEPSWSKDHAVVSEFEASNPSDPLSSAKEAQDRLSSVGLGSIPTWMRPFACLSNGESSRARLAREINDDAVIDNFTHVVNRHAAWAMSSAVGRFIRRRGFKRVVFATSCADVVPWLQPDWLVQVPARAAQNHGRDPPVLAIQHNPTPADGRRPQVRVTMTHADKTPAETQIPAMWSVLRDDGGVTFRKLRGADTSQEQQMLEATVAMDTSTERASEAFDFEFEGKCSFAIPRMPSPPDGFSIGLLVGPSGSGKTTILSRHFAELGDPAQQLQWDAALSVAEQVGGGDAAEARERLTAVGLSCHAWMRPFHTLSTGERFCAELARIIGNDVVIDEFSSTVDRPFARRVACKIASFVRARGFKRVVFATCHDDIIAGLEPDWVFSTQVQKMAIGVKRSAQHGESSAEAEDAVLERQDDSVSFAAPSIHLHMQRVPHNVWSVFQDHHYLDATLNAAAPVYTAWWLPNEGERRAKLTVGLVATLPFPGSARQGVMHRETRCVVLPDFQGLGFGTRISDMVAREYLVRGKRYQSKTAHPRFGQHRSLAATWIGTSGNLKYTTMKGVFGAASRAKLREEGRDLQKLRVCFSHEYIGTEDEQAQYCAIAGEAAADEFMLCVKKGRERDAKSDWKKQGSLEKLRESARDKLKSRAATKRQSGKVRFSGGGVTGPCKLSALVASGFCRAGDGALVLQIFANGKPAAEQKGVAKKAKGNNGFSKRGASCSKAKGSALITTVHASLRESDGAIMCSDWKDEHGQPKLRTFGDVLTFCQAHMSKHGVKEPKSNAQCWQLLQQENTGKDGAMRTLKELKKLAADAANKLKVNPRSVKEWAALREGDLGKIRRLGGGSVNTDIAGSDEDEGGSSVGAGSSKGKAKPKVQNNKGRARAAAVSSSRATGTIAAAFAKGSGKRKRAAMLSDSESDEAQSESEGRTTTDVSDTDGSDDGDFQPASHTARRRPGASPSRTSRRKRTAVSYAEAESSSGSESDSNGATAKTDTAATPPNASQSRKQKAEPKSPVQRSKKKKIDMSIFFRQPKHNGHLSAPDPTSAASSPSTACAAQDEVEMDESSDAKDNDFNVDMHVRVDWNGSPYNAKITAISKCGKFFSVDYGRGEAEDDVEIERLQRL